MKPEPKNRSLPRFLPSSRTLVAAGLALVLPLQAVAGAVELATTPMANSTTTTVKPNLMFVLDDSGSMAWDYLPDTALNFAGQYGFYSSQCNGSYYNPAITYSAPVDSTGAPLNATATTFSAAYKNGYNTATGGTTNLSTGFTGGSGSGSTGSGSSTITPGPAFYYVYSGTQTTPAQKDYAHSTSTFYKECNSDFGSTPGSGVFTRVALAVIPTTTITISGSGGSGGATIKFNSVGSNTQISGITVPTAPAVQIMSGTTSRDSGTSTTATKVAAAINNCTIATTGNCTATGYSATVSGSTVTIIGPADGSANTLTPAITVSAGSITKTINAFPNLTLTTIDSVTVGGVQLLSATTTGSSANTLLATQVNNNINAASATTGYSATVSNNVVTVTGPTSASTLTPVIHILSGNMTAATQAFPLSDPVQVQNFANWYSYYSNRMLMMKTGAGLAFVNVADKYRVGFLTMNANSLVQAGTFDANQKLAWFNALYAANPNNSTPLREILSQVGQYYAHLFGSITTYATTITVNGSGTSSVNSVKVNGLELMANGTSDTTSATFLASQIADQINIPADSQFGASSNGNVVTITSPASGSGFSPVITGSGTMTFSTGAIAGTTTTSKLKGVTPADPVQYSCQQNFTILSTDGYWNGPDTYDLDGNDVGQQDGTAARAFNDGAQTGTTVTSTYSRIQYSSSSTKISSLGGSNCASGKKRGIAQPQITTCDITTVGGVNQAEVCRTWVNDGDAFYTGSYGPASSTCTSSVTLPSPNPTIRASIDTETTPGSVGGTASTLADVAMYYYQTDLRDESLGNCIGALGNDVCVNNVFTSATDNSLRQHMTTFTLGLGVRGTMVYSSSYLTDTTGDFVSVKLGLTATSSVCTWQTSGTVCNWPAPVSGQSTTVDDLWHAAVNGRGAYFSATDPNSLSNGLANALTTISSKVGAAAAAATSTLNPVAGNNSAFVASYTTLKWSGNLESRGINTDTGAVSENATWCVENVASGSCALPGVVTADTSGDTTAYFCVTPNSTICTGGDLDGTDCKVPVATACTGTMNALASDLTDTRTIKTAGDDGASLVNFDATYQAAHASYFNAALLAGLTQWPVAADTSATAIAFRAGAPGVNLVNYLRGQHGHEYDRSLVLPNDQFYRNRDRVLGDALESQPAFLGAPVFSYPYPGYAEFKAAQASRAGTVYMGTNDGMMHAFAADTGVERWAYIPSMVAPGLWKLADKQYADLHTNYVNGSPITTDVCTANCANAVTGSSATDPVWKTILVAGLNGGGRGYFALDISNPSAPALLWELTTNAGIGAVKDNDLGYSFGQPVITRKADGTWVVLVTSGYDNGTDSAAKVSGSFVANSPGGNGKGYLYVLNAGTGAIISKISTGVGTAAAPSGLAKIAGYNAEINGNRASYVYGGDLLGNLWRFDINASTTATVGTGSAFLFATLFSDTGGASPQPIMTTPILGTITGKRIVFVGTGKYLEVSDLTNTQQQSQYAIKDDDAAATLVNPRNTLVQQFLINNPDGTATRLSAASATDTVTGNNSVDFGIDRGWFLDFPDGRERVNIDSKLIEGTLLIPTIVPSSTECSPGGTGWLNFLDYRTGAAVNTTPGIAGVKYDSTIVGINVLFIDGNPVVEVVTSTNPTPSKTDAVDFKATASGFTGKRVLWRELIP
jgi:type IV pilus assembly protein PilY1